MEISSRRVHKRIGDVVDSMGLTAGGVEGVVIVFDQRVGRVNGSPPPDVVGHEHSASGYGGVVKADITAPAAVEKDVVVNVVWSVGGRSTTFVRSLRPNDAAVTLQELVAIEILSSLTVLLENSIPDAVGNGVVSPGHEGARIHVGNIDVLCTIGDEVRQNTMINGDVIPVECRQSDAHAVKPAVADSRIRPGAVGGLGIQTVDLIP